MQNYWLNKIYYLNIRIYHQLVVQGLKTSFRPIECKKLTKRLSPESQLQLLQTRPYFIENQEKNPRNSSNAKIKQKTCLGLIYPKNLSSCSPESYFQYSQTRPHFIHNNKINQMNLSHVVLHRHLAQSFSAQHAEI